MLPIQDFFKTRNYSTFAKFSRTDIKQGFIISSIVGIFLIACFLILEVGLKSLNQPPSSETETVYPTAIPWINDPVSCEKSGRKWERETCQDYHHSYTF